MKYAPYHDRDIKILMQFQFYENISNVQLPYFLSTARSLAVLMKSCACKQVADRGTCKELLQTHTTQAHIHGNERSHTNTSLPADYFQKQQSGACSCYVPQYSHRMEAKGDNGRY